MKKLFLLVIFVLFNFEIVFGMNVNEEEKACLLQGSNLVETDFITVGTSSDLNGTYYVDENLIYELDFSKCGFILETEEVLESVIQLDISYLNLTSFDLSKYPNVIYVNASYNNLTDITLNNTSDLYNLMELDVSNNNITYSQTILDLIEFNSTYVRIHNNPITNEYYHALYNLGVDLDYRPEFTIYLDDMPQIQNGLIVYIPISTPTDLFIDTKYATSILLKNTTGTVLLYEPHMTLVPDIYDITISNGRYYVEAQVEIQPITQSPPVPEQPSEPEDENEPAPDEDKQEVEDNKDEIEEEMNKPEDTTNEEIDIIQPPIIEEDTEEKQESENPENKGEEQLKESLNDEQQIEEIPEKEIEGNHEEPIQGVEEDVKEEVKEVNEEQPSTDEEPLLEVLPNTQDSDSRLLVFGLSCLLCGVLLWFWGLEEH